MLDFLGIGAQKAGTTWLYRILALHPDVRFPAGKEIHFWDAKRERGIKWYTDLFPDAAPLIQGEITPAYAILKKSQIKEIWETYPNLRLLYIIRNPIERAWSSALMALYRAEMTPSEASDQWFIDHFCSEGSMKRGDYRACLETWLSCYPKYQIGLYLFDQIQSNPKALIKKICTHINVSYKPLLSLESDVLHANVRPIPSQPIEPIRPSLMPELRAIYYPKIKEFSAFTGISLRHWIV